jgi:hypothetical protein
MGTLMALPAVSLMSALGRTTLLCHLVSPGALPGGMSPLSVTASRRPTTGQGGGCAPVQIAIAAAVWGGTQKGVEVLHPALPLGLSASTARGVAPLSDTALAALAREPSPGVHFKDLKFSSSQSTRGVWVRVWVTYSPPWSQQGHCQGGVTILGHGTATTGQAGMVFARGGEECQTAAAACVMTERGMQQRHCALGLATGIARGDVTTLSYCRSAMGVGACAREGGSVRQQLQHMQGEGEGGGACSGTAVLLGL